METYQCAPIGKREEKSLSVSGKWGSPPVFRELNRRAETLGSRMGMSRRKFLKSQMGLAASFLAFNTVYGSFFSVEPVEATDPEAMGERMDKLAGQFIFDVQVHYVQDDYPSPDGLLSLRRAAAGWNSESEDEGQTFSDIRFENFYQEIFKQSQTSMAVLSNAPNDDKRAWFLTNEQAMAAREKVNARTGKRSLLAHALITPGQPRWIEDFEQALSLSPDAIKGYTLGDPGGGSKYPWRLDDEKLVYPAYEKMQKAGIRNICIHKGLLPTGYSRWMSTEKTGFANVDDVGPAAKDWPDLNFIIYHSGIQKTIPQAEDVERFKRTGKIPWVTQLAEIPGKYGVDNVYAELGAVFAASCVAHPLLCTGILGTLIRGMGADHICWGTDSVWFGSPQWQIEALRRFEIPENLQKQYGYSALGPADGKVKRMIFGENSSRLYSV